MIYEQKFYANIRDFTIHKNSKNMSMIYGHIDRFYIDIQFFVVQMKVSKNKDKNLQYFGFLKKYIHFMWKQSNIWPKFRYPMHLNIIWNQHNNPKKNGLTFSLYFSINKPKNCILCWKNALISLVDVYFRKIENFWKWMIKCVKKIFILLFQQNNQKQLIKILRFLDINGEFPKKILNKVIFFI